MYYLLVGKLEKCKRCSWLNLYHRLNKVKNSY